MIPKIYEVKDLNIPEEITTVVKTLKNKGFEAYLIGGCVQCTARGKVPAMTVVFVGK